MWKGPFTAASCAPLADVAWRSWGAPRRASVPGPRRAAAPRDRHPRSRSRASAARAPAHEHPWKHAPIKQMRSASTHTHRLALRPLPRLPELQPKTPPARPGHTHDTDTARSAAPSPPSRARQPPRHSTTPAPTIHAGQAQKTDKPTIRKLAQLQLTGKPPTQQHAGRPAAPPSPGGPDPALDLAAVGEPVLGVPRGTALSLDAEDVAARRMLLLEHFSGHI
jgi:hypothetical protein